MSFRGELCRSRWNRGFHPTFPYDDPYVLPPGKGKTRAFKSAMVRATLFVTDALPRHGVVALIQRVIEGCGPKGACTWFTYLPTYPFYITTTQRSREYAFGKTVIDPQHVVRREIALQELWDSPSVIASRVSRTRRSLFFIATGYYIA